MLTPRFGVCSGEWLDQALVLGSGPNTYTVRTVRNASHGDAAWMTAFADVLAQAGLRPAEPGELPGALS